MKDRSSPSSTANHQLRGITVDDLDVWRQELDQVPDIRDDKVSLADTALAEPDYPSVAMVNQIASLLSSHLGPAD
jgi:hypothetical protein